MVPGGPIRRYAAALVELARIRWRSRCVGFARTAFMNRTLTACLLAGIFVVPAFAQQLTPGQQKYRALFQELVETNTQLSNGDCTVLARKIAAHLKAAGLPDGDIHVFTAPNHPKE